MALPLSTMPMEKQGGRRERLSMENQTGIESDIALMARLKDQVSLKKVNLLVIGPPMIAMEKYIK
jgi:hypothetical protein